MILPIVQAGDPVLRRVARPLTREELKREDVQQLMVSMRETMYAAPGVGLAAPQIGEGLRLVVLEDRADSMVDVPKETLEELGREPVPFQILINPRVISASATTASFFEGCLSVPGYRCVVARTLELEVSAWDERGDTVHIHARGWYARILQHEIDHLDGVLCIDRMVSRSLTTVENYKHLWMNQPMTHVQNELGRSGRW